MPIVQVLHDLLKSGKIGKLLGVVLAQNPTDDYYLVILKDFEHLEGSSGFDALQCSKKNFKWDKQRQIMLLRKSTPPLNRDKFIFPIYCECFPQAVEFPNEKLLKLSFEDQAFYNFVKTSEGYEIGEYREPTNKSLLKIKSSVKKKR